MTVDDGLADGVSPTEARPPSHGRAFEVFAVALGLGLTSFGGPIAHLGYFERAYVQRRRWLSAEAFAGLVALCQMAPGPASSQVSFLIGLRRASWPGAFAAWLGFTLPSALIMFAFAWLAPRLTGPLTQAILHGLKLVAVAVVAQAVWSMGRKLCPDLRRTALALVAASLLLLFAGPLMQLLALAVGAFGGVLLCRDVEGSTDDQKRWLSGYFAVMALLAWTAVFVGAYVVYPWYRAHPPAGTIDLTGFPQRLLMSSPTTTGWHDIGMEWKEHIAWFAPISLTALAYLVARHGGELKIAKPLRNAVFGLALLAFTATAVAGFFGAMLNKYAPVRGGSVIVLLKEASHD